MYDEQYNTTSNNAVVLSSKPEIFMTPLSFCATKVEIILANISLGRNMPWHFIPHISPYVMKKYVVIPKHQDCGCRPLLLGHCQADILLTVYSLKRQNTEIF